MYSFRIDEMLDCSLVMGSNPHVHIKHVVNTWIAYMNSTASVYFYYVVI